MTHQPSIFALDCWQKVAPEVDAGVDVLVSQIYYYDPKPIVAADALPHDASTFDEPKHRSRIFASEKAYFLRFCDAVVDHITDDQAPVSYLDLDQTEVSRKHNDETGEDASLLRPSAVPLLRMLNSYFGMTFTNITSRSYDDLVASLNDPNHILALKPFINLDKIIAADHPPTNLPDDLTSTTISFDQHAQFRDILKPPYRHFEAFRNFRTTRNEPLKSIDIVKLMQLAEVHQQGINYLVVDDKEYAGLLKNNSGISLEFNEQAQY